MSNQVSNAAVSMLNERFAGELSLVRESAVFNQVSILSGILVLVVRLIISGRVAVGGFARS